MNIILCSLNLYMYEQELFIHMCTFVHSYERVCAYTVHTRMCECVLKALTICVHVLVRVCVVCVICCLCVCVCVCVCVCMCVYI